MNVFTSVAIRAIFAYIALFALTRIMGKREISQMSFFDYTVGISIGSITANLALDRTQSFLSILPALIVFCVFEILLSYISLKSVTFRRIVDGSSTILVKNGKVMERALFKTRMNMDDLMIKLREKNAFKLADVEFALLEPDGQVSVLLKSSKQPVTPSDMNIQTQYMGLPDMVIEEGRIIGDRLREKELTQSWLMAKLAEQGVYDLSKVMYAQVDTSGNLYVDFYDDSENKKQESTANQLILTKLQKLSSDFASYSIETQNPQVKILYKECEDKINSMINTFQNYVNKRSNKNNLYEITKERSGKH